MDNNKPQRNTDTIVDIVSSESEYEEDGTSETVTANKRAKTVVRSVGKTFSFDSFEGTEDGECSSNSYRASLRSSDDGYEDTESLKHAKFGKNGQHTQLLEKNHLKEKRKISNSKKAPKPPRPRKGPSLDTADLQLVKEIAEQTMKKRARVERLKSLKKRRAVKASPPPTSSNISIFAMIITVLFFIVIIFQGFGSGQSSSFTFDDSPKSTGEPSNGLITVELGNNLLESNGVQQIAKPPKKLMSRKTYRTTSKFVERKSNRL
ncbi:hypothetical protein L1987_29275 [Smallanthus sonchifolius]|uniref:Uncharacterized protein n=1 Tax=Smallanthus sonchifolius TaxID=185202 RepID=A0ACB9HZF5_9ASTR|nr:hypothetical protein L1987_29275 [Smallanthus sonchifolius]